MIKIIADDKIPFLKGALEAFAELHYLPAKDINNTVLQDADALIIRSRTLCNKVLLEGTGVKFIATATIGFDHIDTDYCLRNNIQWTNAPGCNSDSVMQYLASALVKVSMKYKFNFSDKILGIVGYGHIGSKVAKMASALGFSILLNDPPLQRTGVLSQFVSLAEIKAKADIITFHVPLINQGIDKTWHMVDANFLSSIKPDTILINTSRGEVIDNEALKMALSKQQIKAAVLDVWENEPNIDFNLLELLDLATPHIAGYSADGKANGTAMSVQAISDYFGFGLKNWFPAYVPLPENLNMELNETEESKQKILSQLILETYAISADHQRLFKSVSTFEKQRGDYPIRREFQNYSVNLGRHDSSLEKAIKALGFKLG